MSDQWISTKKAAELLGVSQRTIQNWVDDGKLLSSRTAGGHRRLDPNQVSQFIQKNYQPKNLFHVTEHPVQPQDGDILNVLIVEDDFNLLRLCELRFSQFTIPHRLHLAPNPFLGLIMIGKYQPHLIFTDLRMPQVNGLQLISEIIKLPDMLNTRIVVMTGLEISEIVKMGPLPEGLMVLPKPIPFNTVETILYQQAQALGLRTASSLDIA